MNDLSQQISIRGKDGVSAGEFFSELLRNISECCWLKKRISYTSAHCTNPGSSCLYAGSSRGISPKQFSTHVSSRLTSVLDTYVGQALWAKLYISSLWAQTLREMPKACSWALETAVEAKTSPAPSSQWSNNRLHSSWGILVLGKQIRLQPSSGRQIIPRDCGGWEWTWSCCWLSSTEPRASPCPSSAHNLPTKQPLMYWATILWHHTRYSTL